MEQNKFDFFYSNEHEQYLFLQLPVMLIKHELFKHISSEAKILYSLLLNRTSLSKKNEWKDELGRVYIIYPNGEIMDDLNCSEKKAIKSMRELTTIGLVKTTRQGLNRPNLIYVMNFATELKYQPKHKKEPENTEDKRNCKKDSFGAVQNAVQEQDNIQPSNMDNNNIDFSIKNDIKSTSSHAEDDSQKKDNDDDLLPNHDEIKKQIQENIEYDIYLRNNKKDEIELMDELINCMVDVICTKGDTVKINGEDKSRNLVISQYMNLTSMDIDHVIHRYKAQSHKIKYLHSYLKTMLYTARQEVNHFYTNQVKSDNLNLAFSF
jgi:hypothetical protein